MVARRKLRRSWVKLKGVYKTELDPVEPKVTVLGNVEAQGLIKKLLKSGKQAAIWSCENQSGCKGEDDVHSFIVKNQKEKSTSGSEQTKYSEAQATSSTKLTFSEIDKEEHNDTSLIVDMTNTSSTGLMKFRTPIFEKTEDNCIRSPSTVHNSGKVTTETHTQYYYMVEPRPTILPYCTIYPYNQDSYDRRITCQPLFQAPVTRAGDYFSYENTVGCQVM